MRALQWISIGLCLMISSGGCRGEAPTESNERVPTTIAFTMAEGLSNPAPPIRGNLGAFKLETEYQGFDFEMKTRRNTDVTTVTVHGVPGSHSGWHYHPAAAIVIVQRGTLTSYVAEQGACLVKTYSAGMAFTEGTVPHIIRNSGIDDVEVSVIFFTPAGAPPRIDVPDPGICPASAP